MRAQYVCAALAERDATSVWTRHGVTWTRHRDVSETLYHADGGWVTAAVVRSFYAWEGSVHHDFLICAGRPFARHDDAIRWTAECLLAHGDGCPGEGVV